MPKQAKAAQTPGLDAALAAIDKEFGTGTIARLNDNSAYAPVDAIPTGSIALDHATGIGGLPRGRVVEIFGPEGSGKTTAALSVVAQAQRAGLVAAFIDAEHALDPDYAAAIGVDTDALLVSQPDNGEQALIVTDMLAQSKAVGIVVIDSVAALVPQAELNGEIGDAHVGLQARMMSQGLRILTGHVSTSKTCCVFINQLREKVGILFGNPETTPGGKALKFYSSMRLDVRRIETLKDGVDTTGSRLRVKLVKNKCAPPFKIAEFDLLFGKGISSERELLDYGVALGLIKKAGAWYTALNGEQIGQGKDNAAAHLAAHPDLADALGAAVRAALAQGPAPATLAKPPAARGKAPVG